MAKIARILPLPIAPKQGEKSMQNALAERGHMRHPGTGAGFPPIRGMNGKYLTGLDENADYIMRIPSPALRQQEQEIVKARRDRLEKATGLFSNPDNREHTGLGPRAPYYSGVFDTGKMNTHEVASRIKLIDGANVFNFGSPFKEVEYWYAIQHTGLIASSIEDWKAGRCKPTVQFYVDNPEAEAEAIYSEKKAANTAVIEMSKMSLEKRKKVAKLIGLPIGDNDREQIVYNGLDNFIRSGQVTFGEFQGQRAVTLFNSIAALSPDTLHIKALVKEALILRVYIQKSGFIYEGEQLVYNSQEEMISKLAQPNMTMELKALEIKVADKKKMKGVIQGYVPPTVSYEPEPEPIVTEEIIEEVVIPVVNSKAESLAKARAAKQNKKIEEVTE